MELLSFVTHHPGGVRGEAGEKKSPLPLHNRMGGVTDLIKLNFTRNFLMTLMSKSVGGTLNFSCTTHPLHPPSVTAPPHTGAGEPSNEIRGRHHHITFAHVQLEMLICRLFPDDNEYCTTLTPTPAQFRIILILASPTRRAWVGRS